MDEITTSHRKAFYEQLEQIMSNKAINTKLLTLEKYNEKIRHVKDVKGKITGKTPKDYSCLKRYDIWCMGDEERLIVPIVPGKPIIMYVYNEELFDIINIVHINTGHVGRDRMMVELRRQYSNIITDVVKLYLSLCVQCKDKHNKLPRKNRIDAIHNEELEIKEENITIENGFYSSSENQTYFSPPAEDNTSEKYSSTSDSDIKSKTKKRPNENNTADEFLQAMDNLSSAVTSVNRLFMSKLMKNNKNDDFLSTIAERLNRVPENYKTDCFIEILQIIKKYET